MDVQTFSVKSESFALTWEWFTDEVCYPEDRQKEHGVRARNTVVHGIISDDNENRDVDKQKTNLRNGDEYEVPI